MAESTAVIYQAAHDGAGTREMPVIKCDMCGEKRPATEFQRLDEICHERLWCQKCFGAMKAAEIVSKAINAASDEVTAAIQKYIRTLAANVDLNNPQHERLLTRCVNFYRKAKLVFARDTDEGRRKSAIGALVSNGYPVAGNYAIGGGTQAWVDTNESMSDFGDVELDGIPRDQGINGQETMGSRWARELMSFVPQVLNLLKRQVTAQEIAARGAGGAIPREGGGAETSAVPVPPAPEGSEVSSGS